MAIAWTTDHGCPVQSWAFVLAAESPYCLLLTWRPGRDSWRAFVIPNARNQVDLYRKDDEGPRWSRDVFEEKGIMYRDDQVNEAQQALVRLLATHLGLDEKDIVPARNGRPAAAKKLSQAQLAQIARTQPQRRR